MVPHYFYDFIFLILLYHFLSVFGWWLRCDKITGSRSLNVCICGCFFFCYLIFRYGCDFQIGDVEEGRGN